jgi:hypothetical protein
VGDDPHALAGRPAERPAVGGVDGVGGAKTRQSLRCTKKRTAAAFPARTSRASSRRCLRPRSVTESGKSARSPSAMEVFFTSRKRGGSPSPSTTKSTREFSRPKGTSRRTKVRPPATASRPARSASPTAGFGIPVLTPTQVRPTRACSQVHGSFRSGFGERERRTRWPGAMTPRREPVFAHMATTVAPSSRRTSAKNRRRRPRRVPSTSGEG